MEVLVFKTNLTDAKRIGAVENILNVHPDISRWNVDLNDCDNVLRIVANDVSPKEIENIISRAGYYCVELE